MATNKKQDNHNHQGEEVPGKSAIQRRTLLKAFAGIPVLGLMGLGVLQKRSFDKQQQHAIADELGLGKIRLSLTSKHTAREKGELIRIGIVGFGNRANQLVNALGFMHPEDMELKQKNGALDRWLGQESLNIAIVGICDVFDLHAERGLAAAGNRINSSADDVTLPIKRYRYYHEMLAAKEIDAVIIATPDHHHALMAIAAAKAGKHVYCEKSPAQSEDEINELYNVIKASKVTYQLGHQIPQNVIFQQAKEIIQKNILGKISLIETTSNRNTASGAWIRHLDDKGQAKPGDEQSIDWEQWLGGKPKVPFSIDRFYNWTKWFDYDMGMIGQLFTHEYDAVNQLLGIGIPRSVSTSGGIYYWKDNREIPDLLHCVFEYPNHELTMLYSATLASSRNRGRVFMGNEASMELGNAINITVDSNSTRFKKQLENGTINPSEPLLTLNPNSGNVDAVTSATEKYYSSRGLTYTYVDGKQVDVTHLHLKEWLDCIRSGETPTANIERAFEEGITIVMAHRSYLEKRTVEWDPISRKII
ncbi:gfo/Idh/MocA family oxidoreductase [Maribellus luteus]|uniref:Gfo/Idh/MocA family oxidoreductase n=1 Tax=Maribellus luteus TaxID=2305463 RepID=A0A399SR59_9BACT|nr:Gfo/Idh/MocA family oxidoreductase [Maribellus luteus]RIJ45414.1 gfo/Idh/MocA family oxidoreductase [Maribellus luteus]